MYPLKKHPTYCNCQVGKVSPECLKRVFFGDPFHQEKGHGFLLGYEKIWKTIKLTDRGENV